MNIFNISNKVYDYAKWWFTIGFPAFITFSAGMIELWQIPNGTRIVGTMTLLNALGGAWLGISSKKYYEMNEAVGEEEKG